MRMTELQLQTWTGVFLQLNLTHNVDLIPVVAQLFITLLLLSAADTTTGWQNYDYKHEFWSIAHIFLIIKTRNVRLLINQGICTFSAKAEVSRINPLVSLEFSDVKDKNVDVSVVSYLRREKAAIRSYFIHDK